jgi:predicted enzyme related to lactoylglutathione lyase
LAEPRRYPEGVTCWIDVEQPDLEAARAFYADVFGWAFDDVGLGTMIRRPGYGDHLAATVDPDIHDHDATAAAAESLGGTVLNRGDTEWTRDALLRDPRGALFTVSQFTPPT